MIEINQIRRFYRNSRYRDYLDYFVVFEKFYERGIEYHSLRPLNENNSSFKTQAFTTFILETHSFEVTDGKDDDRLMPDSITPKLVMVCDD